MKRHRNDGLRKLCGCARRRWPTCGHGWHFSFQWRGVHHRFSLDRHLGRHVAGKTEAKTEADKLRATIRRGEFSPVQTDEVTTVSTPVTLDRFGAVYLDRALKGRRDDRSQLKRLWAFVLPDTGERLGAKVVKDIVEDNLEVFAESLRAQKLAANTRNHYVQLLKAMFRWAAKKGYIDRTPISEDSALKREKTNGRVRRLLGDEEHGLLAAAPPRAQRLIIGALETGCRLGELLSLLWKDVDLTLGEIPGDEREGPGEPTHPHFDQAQGDPGDGASRSGR